MNRREFLATAGVLGVNALTGCGRSSGNTEPVRTNVVTIPDRWVYEPEVIRVDSGTTVTWTNTGPVKHTVTFREETPIDFDVELAPGEATRREFTGTGRFEYYCRYHRPDMTGTVLVG